MQPVANCGMIKKTTFIPEVQLLLFFESVPGLRISCADLHKPRVIFALGEIPTQARENRKYLPIQITIITDPYADRKGMVSHPLHERSCDG